MNRVEALATTPLLSITRFDHPRDEGHTDPPEERAFDFSVNFVERGRFGLRVGRRRWVLRPGTLFVARPGLVFHCDHEAEMPDDVCVSLAFAPELAAEAPAARGGPPVVPLTNRLAYLRRGLLAASDTLTVESLAAEVMAALPRQGGTPPRRLFRPGQLAWYARRVDTARQRLQAEFAEPHSLGELARDVGMSPYHFSRVFRELAGVPPHRYLRDLRLRRAAERLREGASVTEACFASGFGNLSHFTRSFRRAFGVPPSKAAFLKTRLPTRRGSGC